MYRFLTLYLLVSLPLGAHASILQEGEIGVFGDAEATQIEAAFEVGVPFAVHIVARPGPLGMTAWETSISFPSEFLLLNVEFESSTSIDVGIGDNNLIIGIGDGCQTGNANGLVPLAKVWLLQFQYGVGGSLCLGASSPSSVGSSGPAFSNCLNQVAPMNLASNGCVRLGTGLCEGVLLARTALGFEDVDGTAGAVLPMDFQGFSFDFLDCVGQRGNLTTFEVDISWDPAVATLASVVPKDIPTDWTLSSTIGVGVASLTLSGGNPFPIDANFTLPQSFATLNWQTSSTPGATVVRIDHSELNFVYGGTGPITTSFGGSLSTMPVATDQTSFGAVKARF